MSKIDTGDKELDEALTLEGELKGLVESLVEDDVPLEDIVAILIEAMDIKSTREAISRLEAEYSSAQDDYSSMATDYSLRAVARQRAFVMFQPLLPTNPRNELRCYSSLQTCQITVDALLRMTGFRRITADGIVTNNREISVSPWCRPALSTTD